MRKGINELACWLLLMRGLMFLTEVCLFLFEKQKDHQGSLLGETRRPDVPAFAADGFGILPIDLLSSFLRLGLRFSKSGVRYGWIQPHSFPSPYSRFGRPVMR